MAKPKKCKSRGNKSFGQLTLIDENRSLNTAYEGYIYASPMSDATTANGLYSNDLILAGYANNPYQVEQIYYNASAGQTSTVTPARFSANASCSAWTSNYLEPYRFFSNASSQCLYSVDFSVNAPTSFSITGNISGGYNSQSVCFALASVILTDNAQTVPIYLVSASEYDQFSAYFYDPVAFSTMLEPGHLYGLNAITQTSCLSYEGTAFPPVATFNFTVSVPEPDSLLVLMPLGLLMLNRRRQRGRLEATAPLAIS